jgi:hypothetical protein
MLRPPSTDIAEPVMYAASFCSHRVIAEPIPRVPR